MKAISKLAALALFVSILCLSCENSVKSYLLTNTTYSLSAVGLSDNNSIQNILFDDEGVVLVNNEDEFTYSWQNDNTIFVHAYGNDIKLFFKKLENGDFLAAILYSEENLPKNQNDWDILRHNDRVLQLSNSNNSSALNKDIEIAGNMIPREFVPPAGLYYGPINPRAAGKPLIKVKRNGQSLTIETGGDLSLEGEGIQTSEKKILSYDSNGEFILDLGYDTETYQYVGNGVIEDEHVWEFGDGSEMITDRYINSDVYSDDYRPLSDFQLKHQRKLLKDYIKLASLYKSIGIEDRNNKRIVKFSLTMEDLSRTYFGYVTEIDIPLSKLWTPLYFSFNNGGVVMNAGEAEILTKTHDTQSTGRMYYYENIVDNETTKTWWYKNSGFYLPKYENFHSVEMSLRNNETISGRNAIYFSFFDKKHEYTFYFLEEDI